MNDQHLLSKFFLVYVDNIMNSIAECHGEPFILPRNLANGVSLLAGCVLVGNFYGAFGCGRFCAWGFWAK